MPSQALPGNEKAWEREIYRKSKYLTAEAVCGFAGEGV
jgi:hypothetical protein